MFRFADTAALVRLLLWRCKIPATPILVATAAIGVSVFHRWPGSRI